MTVRTPEEIENERRTVLVNIFATSGSLILFIFGILSMSAGFVVLGSVVLGASILSLGLMVYGRLSGRIRTVSYLFSALAFMLAIFLVVHGGVKGAGAYFSFPLAIIMVMTGFTSVRFTLTICSLFLSVVALALFGPVDEGLVYPYGADEKMHIMLGLAVLVLLAVFSEWIRLRSYSATLNTHEQLRTDARYDALTKLLNRRGFEEAMAGLPPERFPVVLAILDLDHFKSVNDEHGHEAGDHALRAFARHLRPCVRGGDLLCRWGGEEFLLLITEAGPDEALAVVDDIRIGFARTVLPVGENGLKLTFSAGLSCLQNAGGFEQALVEADESLYRAKDRGRNHLELSEAENTAGEPDDAGLQPVSAAVPRNKDQEPPDILPA